MKHFFMFWKNYFSQQRYPLWQLIVPEAVSDTIRVFQFLKMFSNEYIAFCF